MILNHVKSNGNIALGLLLLLLLKDAPLRAQTCPANATTTISTYPNTYYPGTTATLSAGATSIALGAVSYGTTPISSGDLLLLIQMQGAQIGTGNDSTYGKGVIGGGHVNGYLNNAQLLAGNMEYVVAANAVPVAGGTLNLLSPTVNTYKKAGFGTAGQYRYQVIRVASYYNLIIGANITVPVWNGVSGGVFVISVTDTLNMNGKTITASGAGFRGGGGIALAGGAGAVTDFYTLSTATTNGSKGEGIAGMPRYVNNNNVLLDNGTALEGYVNGSFAMGAPGNAGGGGTDGTPSLNNQNSGGGGGANGGIGGKGGSYQFAAQQGGGEPGAIFAQVSRSRLVMGGGGGAGTTNQGSGTPSGGIASSGTAGGGIIIIYSDRIINAGILDVSGSTGNATVVNDGAGGGGAGGSVIVSAKGTLTNVTVNARGGTGGSPNLGGASAHGPGGGGGGGVVYSSGVLNGATAVSGGASGLTASGVPSFATAGASGVLVQNQTFVPPLSCTVLPIAFLQVSATGTGTKVNIAWQVANQQNVQAYIVERSFNAIDYIPVGTRIAVPLVNGAGSYTFTDTIALANHTGYYRIRSVNNGGQLVFSGVVVVRLSSQPGSFVISPNPAGSTTTLQLVSAINSRAEMRLLDMSGRLWRQQYYEVTTGLNILPVEGLQNLRSGLYILQYNDAVSTRTAKLVIGP